MNETLPCDVWKLVGTTPGPTTMVIGGTHGDELTGIEVIKKLLEVFQLQNQPTGTLENKPLRGTVVFLFGNPEAIRLRQRAASGGRDLNRCFIQSELDAPALPTDSADLIRARELAPLLAQADFVIDLHSTSSESPPFVCLGRDSEAHRHLYQHLPIEYVLSDPDDILAHDEGRPGRGTTDDYVDLHGGIAIAYETGKEDDLSRIDHVFHEMMTLLHEIGHLEGGKEGSVQSAPEVFALAESVHAHSDVFIYEPGMNKGWQAVNKGQLVGVYDDGTEERISEDGMIVFPKSANKIRTGKNIYYLARKNLA